MSLREKFGKLLIIALRVKRSLFKVAEASLPLKNVVLYGVEINLHGPRWEVNYRPATGKKFSM